MTTTANFATTATTQESTIAAESVPVVTTVEPKSTVTEKTPATDKPAAAGNDLLSAEDSVAIIDAMLKIKNNKTGDDLPSAKEIKAMLEKAGVVTTGKFGVAVDNAKEGAFFSSASAGDILNELSSAVHKDLKNGKATGLSAKNIAEALERANVQLGDKGAKDKHAGVTAQSVRDLKYYQAQLEKSSQAK